MTAQEQQKPNTTSMDLEEPEERRKMAATEQTAAKKRNPLFLFLAVLMCILCLYLGNYLRLHSSLLKDQKAKEGYLSPTEFVLIDSDTKEPVQKLSADDFQSQYVFTYGVKHYETFRGLKPGDSWDKFAQTYGDTIAQEIRCETKNGEEKEILTYNDMTIDEFQKEIVEKGVIDLENTEIDIYFRTGTDGKKLYYSEKDMLRAIDQYNKEPRILHPLTKEPDQLGFYTLHFTFETDIIDPDSGTILGFLSSSFEDY